MLRRILFSTALAVILFTAGCATIPEGASRTDVSFSDAVLPVIRSSFLPLLTEETGLDATTWSGLMAGSDQGEVVIPFDSDRSLLIELAERAGADGPPPRDIELIRAWIDAGAPSDTGEIAYDDADQLLYVCNQGSAVISIIDMESNLVVRTVDLRDLGFSENARPHHAAVASDGNHWYVSLIGENTVLKFDRENNLVQRVPFEAPGMLALDPIERRLYVGRSMSAVNPPQRIGVIESGSMSIEEVDVFYPRPHALAVTPDGRTLFSASLGVNQMATVDAETMDMDIVELPGHHHMFVQFAVSPSGRQTIVGGEMSGALLFIDTSNPLQPDVVKTLQLGGAPWHPSYLPDGSRAFVPRKRADAISVIDSATMTEVAVISGAGIAEPHGSAVRTDGRFVYVSNNNLNEAYTPRYHDGGDPSGSVVVIDAVTMQVVKVIEVENYPTGIGTRPAR